MRSSWPTRTSIQHAAAACAATINSCKRLAVSDSASSQNLVLVFSPSSSPSPHTHANTRKRRDDELAQNQHRQGEKSSAFLTPTIESVIAIREYSMHVNFSKSTYARLHRFCCFFYMLVYKKVISNAQWKLVLLPLLITILLIGAGEGDHIHGERGDDHGGGGGPPPAAAPPPAGQRQQ